MTDKVSTEEKILKSAALEFSIYGFDGARIDNIARKAKVNKAMIYYYFKNKEMLYEHILIDLYEKIFKNLSFFAKETDYSDEDIYEFVRKFVDFMFDMDPMYTRMMYVELAAGGKFFKKIAIPNIIMPVKSMVQDLFGKLMKENYIKEVDPFFIIFQLISPAIVLNLMRLTIKDSEIGKLLFQEGYKERFKESLILVFRDGLKPVLKEDKS